MQKNILNNNKMEKLQFKNYKDSEEYKKGLQEFHEGKVPKSESKKYSWYRKVVSGAEWKDKYKDSGHCILSMTRNGNTITDVEFAFMSCDPQNGHLEITDINDLIKIDNYRRAINHRPFVLEDIKK